MNRWIVVILFAFLAPFTHVGDGYGSSLETGTLCSDSWYRFIEEKIITGDGRGHGPDFGSDEWKSVVEFKIGIRGNADIPRRDSEAWCRHIDHIVRSRITPSVVPISPR